MTWNEFLTEAGTILGLAKKGLDKPMDTPPPAANTSATPDPIIADLQSQLSAAKEKISTLSAAVAQKETLITKLTADLATSAQALATAQASIETKASQRAAEIVASVGQPPIPTTPTAAPASATKPASELKGFAKVVAAFREQAQVK